MDQSIDTRPCWLFLEINKNLALIMRRPFAPVIKMTIGRTILAIAASESWQVHQMDVKNAFLYGDLKAEVYIRFPTSMPSPLPNAVSKLKCSLYGLKQTLRIWFEKFHTTLLSFSFIQNKYDPSLFIQRSLELSYFLFLWTILWSMDQIKRLSIQSRDCCIQLFT